MLKSYIKYWAVGLVVFWIVLQCVYLVLTVFFGNTSEPLADRIDDYKELAAFSVPAAGMILCVSTLLSTATWIVVAKPLGKRDRVKHADRD